VPRVATLLVVLAALALAAAGCGGGGDSGSSASGTDPDTWAADVCGALQTWADDIKSGSQSLSSDLQSSSDLKAVKQKVVSFLDDVEKSTEKMVDDVKAAGSPAVKDGEAIQNDLEAGLTEARDSFDHALAQAKELKTNNPQAFVTGVTAMGQQIQTELNATANHFNALDKKYDASDLNKAINDEQSCKPFLGSSSSG
jgi:hypothetical protein